jgi:uncharacterized protein YsxB (DUF464 family)
MISITIFRDDNMHIAKYIIEGHARSSKLPTPIEFLIRIIRFKGEAGYPEAGYDIICAAVSSVAQMPLIGMIDVMGLVPGVDIEDGYLECIVPQIHDSKMKEKAEVLLETMYKTMVDLKKKYSGFIKIVETEV